MDHYTAFPRNLLEKVNWIQTRKTTRPTTALDPASPVLVLRFISLEAQPEQLLHCAGIILRGGVRASQNNIHKLVNKDVKRGDCKKLVKCFLLLHGHNIVLSITWNSHREIYRSLKASANILTRSLHEDAGFHKGPFVEWLSWRRYSDVLLFR